MRFDSRRRTPPPKILIRARDLVEEYGMTEGAAYDMLHQLGVVYDGGYYIKRTVAEAAMERKAESK